MDFEFRSDNERLAVAGDDVDIYPRLGITNTARWNRNEKYGPDLVMTEPKNIEITGYHYSGQPGMLPLALNDLQQFVNSLNSLAGYWSVLWFSGIHHNADHLNADGFRCVVAWGSVDLTIRPVPGVDGPSRLSIYPGDVRAFLHAASDAILKADPGNPIAGVIGRGCMASTKMPFEWQIAHAPEDMRTNRVKRWRYKMCGTARDYTARESQYLIHLGHQGLPDPRQGKRTFHNQGHQQRKRSNLEMDVGQNIGPNLKRQDTGSSQWGSESQSSFSSPEHSRAPSVAGWNQPIMGPPPPLGPGQPGGYIEHPFRHEQSRRGSRGSQGSTSSGVSHAGSRMASLTFQSPFEGSSEGMGPPPEGSPWGGPHGVTRTVPGQPAGGFEAQAPFHGYQGPGQVHHAPVYGQPTEVFGYMRTDFQGPPQREFQVGIQHTQQFGAYAGGNPQHPGLQHQDMPPQPPPALSNIDPAQLLAPQTTLPPVGQNYPSSSPPATHPMPAELTHSPEHEDVPESSGSDSESDGEDDRSSYQHAAATQPLLDTGGQDRGRFYASPGAEAQPTYRDPYMGAGESDDE